MTIRLADPGDKMLYRIGRPPDPLAWPEPPYRGTGRFDDPLNQFGVLYAAVERRTRFLETLDTYRPDTALLQRLLVMGAGGFIPQSGIIPDNYFTKLLGRLRVTERQRWLDLRASAPETAIALSRESTFAAQLPELGYGKRFKPGDLLGSDRRLTQELARWAYEEDFVGIAYSCSHDIQRDCWAIFDSAKIASAGSPLTIEPDDPDVIAAAKLFGLTVTF